MITDIENHAAALETRRFVFVDHRCVVRVIGVSKQHLRWVVIDGAEHHLGFWYDPWQDAGTIAEIARMALGDFS